MLGTELRHGLLLLLFLKYFCEISLFLVFIKCSLLNLGASLALKIELVILYISSQFQAVMRRNQQLRSNCAIAAPLPLRYFKLCVCSETYTFCLF